MANDLQSQRTAPPVGSSLFVGQFRPTGASRATIAGQRGGRLDRDRLPQRNVRDTEDGRQTERDPLVVHRHAVLEGHVWTGRPDTKAWAHIVSPRMPTENRGQSGRESSRTNTPPTVCERMRERSWDITSCGTRLHAVRERNGR
jgi:hypothetical protein